MVLEVYDPATLQAAIEHAVAEINREIADFNLKVPSPRFQRGKINAAREIARLEGRLGDAPRRVDLLEAAGFEEIARGDCARLA